MSAPQHGSGEHLTAAQAFGNFCAGLECDALPAAVVARPNISSSDDMSIALMPPQSIPAARYARLLLHGRSQVAPRCLVALIRSTRLGDTFLPGSIHNESFVCSPTSTLAEECGASGKRFLVAVVAGFEVACAGLLEIVTDGVWTKRALPLRLGLGSALIWVPIRRCKSCNGACIFTVDEVRKDK
jgi:hypothetical protein